MKRKRKFLFLLFLLVEIRCFRLSWMSPDFHQMSPKASDWIIIVNINNIITASGASQPENKRTESILEMMLFYSWLSLNASSVGRLKLLFAGCLSVCKALKRHHRSESRVTEAKTVWLFEKEPLFNSFASFHQQITQPPPAELWPDATSSLLENKKNLFQSVLLMVSWVVLLSADCDHEAV